MQNLTEGFGDKLRTVVLSVLHNNKKNTADAFQKLEGLVDAPSEP